MNKRIVVFYVSLFFGNIYLSIAQNSINISAVAKKKNNITQDLNRLELEKINSISVNKNQQKDSVVLLIYKENDSVFKEIIPVSIDINNQNNTTIQHLDSIPDLKNSIFPIKSDDVVDLKKFQKNIAVEKLSFQDSILNASYIIQSSFADSVRSVHKHWLDSTLISLPKKKPVVISINDPIEIFISGGGFYAGTNPKIYDRLTIFRTGLVHREFKTKLQGEQVEEKMLSKEELMQLAKYIIDMGFFEFNNLYECKKENYDCKTRLKFKPEPIPLTVSVVVGSRRKKILVSFFAPKIEPNYVDYPIALEKIVESIYDVLK